MPNQIPVFISSPAFPKSEHLSKEDVWGKYDPNTRTETDGMIVARRGEKCPIFEDILPYKSVTVICEKDQYAQVAYWLEYVHGADCISKMKESEGGKLAIRSDYQCW